MAWPAIIAGAAQLGSSFLQGWQSRRNQRQQNRANMEMAKYAYSRDLEMWRRQNRYNSPEAQMRRFEEAGLNKNLIYGQGTPGNAAQLPRYQAPQMEYNALPPIDPFSALSGYMDINQRKETINLTKQQIQVQQAQEALTEANTARVWNQATISDVEAEIARVILGKNAGELESIAKGRIGGMKAEDWLKSATAQIRRWEAGLTRQNINPRDSLLMRQLFDLLEAIGFAPSQIKQYLK